MVDTSIIISVYNDTRWLEMILAALAAQSVPAGTFEAVVADDGSDRHMRGFIEEIRPRLPFALRHVWHEDRGWRKNIILNRAIEASEGRYIIFLDGDCIPHPRFVEEHLRWRTPGRILAGRRVQLTQKICDELTPRKVSEGYLPRQTARLLWAGITGRERFAENCVRISSPLLRRFIKDKDRGLLGCNFSLWREDIVKVNGFDERYLHPATGEDTDLELRMRNAGITVLTKKHQLTVYHKKHRQQDFSSPENAAIYRENTAMRRSYTPYGMVKSEI